jgi:anti-sigma factor RsiW
MTDFSQHPTDMLQDAVDGRLDGEARAALDAHLASCESCRRELEALRWTKAQVARAERAIEAPGDLDARARAWLDEEDRLARHAPEAARPRGRQTWLALGAAAAALVVAALWLQRSEPPSVPAAAAAHLRAFQSGALELGLQSSDPQTLEAYLRSTGAPASRVYDFGMMGHTLVGVRTHALGEHPTALAAYRTADGPSLLCEMYVGLVETLPPPVERRMHNGVDFLVYREAEVTVVFWQEGKVVCVLSGTGDPEAILALAFAKAVKV